MEICEQFYTHLQQKQRELHQKIKSVDDGNEKHIKMLHKRLETIDRLITLVLKFIYDSKE